MENRRKFLIASVGIITLSGCTEDSGSSDAVSSNDGSSNGDSLDEKYPNRYASHQQTQLVVLSDIEASADSFSITITGTVVNGSDTDYEYAQIEFGLYDDSGAKVGSAIDNISGLESGQRWRYEAIGTGEGTARWELESMSAY